MAINQKRRDNLLAEATAYSRRILYRAAGLEGVRHQELFVGARENGNWSVYFDEDPVLQFNEQSQIRRAFFDETRYAAYDGVLVQLQRDQQGGRVEFVHVQVSKLHEESMLELFQQLLRQAVADIQSRKLIPAGQFPTKEEGLSDEVIAQLVLVSSQLSVADCSGA